MRRISPWGFWRAAGATAALVMALVALPPVALASVPSAGALLALGDNNDGQLGNSTNVGTANANPTPTAAVLPGRASVEGVRLQRLRPAPGQSGQVTQLAAGQYFSLVLTSSGQLYAFGADGAGQLANGTKNAVPNPTPTLVALPGQVGRIAHIAAGEDDAASGRLERKPVTASFTIR